MHAALQIRELVELICSQISPFSGMHELAVLARTAKTFHDPALDNLWRIQTTLAHLLRCMPSDLWNQAVQLGALHNLRLARPIVPADWRRPSYYLRRIKVFCPSAGSQFPSQEILEILAHCRPGEPLFPKLRYLDCTDLGCDWYPCIPICLGTSMRSLAFDVSAARVSSLSLVPAIALKCPHLTDVTITHSSPDMSAHTRAAVSLFVRGLRYIESLNICVLDEAAFAHLAGLSGLKTLRVEMPVALTPLPSFDDDRFSTLISLDIFTRSIEVANCCITSLLSPPKLARLAIHCDLPSACLSAISALYRAVTQATRQASLHYLVIRIYSRTWTEDIYSRTLTEERTIKHMMLRGFCRFGDLVQVSLKIPGGFDLDDATAAAVAQAWPNIRALCLAPAEGRGARCTTLAALVVFAENCPKLESLALEFNALEVPVVSRGVPLQTALTTLCTGHSPIAEPMEVASYLATIFPRLSLVKARRIVSVDVDGGPVWADDTSEFYRHWKEVNWFLKQYPEG
ncbi:hypothetical protein DFH06DRAFT_1130973 [Mycena polygramma]|nr:hypothetical protein DFH06DRAFT_1130973 [Mycena polygramma]